MGPMRRMRPMREGTQTMQAASDTVQGADLLPVRMLNEYAYCPRLFHLMHAEGRWEDNVYTEQGRQVHRRVDAIDHVLPDALPGKHETHETHGTHDVGVPGDEPPEITRSVPLSSARLGLTAKLDLVSSAESEAVPVERKRGKVPDNPERSWEPERVQLMAQGLLLREHGYRCDHGILYFAGSRTRVDVPFTAELEARTLALIEQTRLAALASQLPPPLDDSPKCNGCSLSGICLPDETSALRAVPPDPAAPEVRRLYPVRDDALPFYVQEQGAVIGKTSNSLVVRKDGAELASVPLKDISQLVLCGNILVTAQAIHLLCEAGIPVVHLSSGHWFYGMTSGFAVRNGFNRAAQYEAARDPQRALALAREIVRAKGANQRTMLRRNAQPRPEDALVDMADWCGRAEKAEELPALLGLEGALAAAYFRHFGTMIRAPAFDGSNLFEGRNRRPPLDPVNALLSFGYALLAKECTVALHAEGLDPWWGLYHQARHGRPGLALDLMEEFRPLVVDSAVLSALNTGMVAPRNFECSAAGCLLQPAGRKAFIQAYEARLDQLVTHPLFDYRASWRSIIRMQARLLGRWFRGDVPAYTGFTTR